MILVVNASPAEGAILSLIGQRTQGADWIGLAYEYMAVKLGYTVRSIKRAVKRLEAEGWIEVWRQKTDNPRRDEINRYRLSVPASHPCTVVEKPLPDSEENATSDSQASDLIDQINSSWVTRNVPLSKRDTWALGQWALVYGLQRLREVWAAVERKGRGVANPMGWVRRALEQGWEVPALPSMQVDSYDDEARWIDEDGVDRTREVWGGV